MKLRSQPIRLAAALLPFALVLGACHSHELPEVDCDASEPQSYTELQIVSACTSCHSSTLSASARSGAPVGVDYDTHAAAMENAEHGAEVVKGGSMPPAGGVSAEAKEEFYVWALCGTPP